MTREEAIKYAESKKIMLEALIFREDCVYGNYAMYSTELSFVNAALSALRPVGREQITKIWPGCDACEIPCNNCESIYAWDRYGKPQECTGCPENGYKNYTPESQFCEFCGRPLTDEAVEMVIERLEALKDGKGV